MITDNLENGDGDNEQPIDENRMFETWKAMEIIYSVVGNDFCPLQDDYSETYAVIHNNQTFISIKLLEALYNE